MLPLLIAIGAPVIGAAAFLGLKTRCAACESVFTWNYSCLVCGKDVCGDCGIEIPKIEHDGWPVSPKGRVCKIHLDELEKQIEKLKSAIDLSVNVEVFSKNFRGKAPPAKLKQLIETQFHADRDDAERELRIRAAHLGALVVRDVDFLREKKQDGNYVYSVWKASGTV